MSQGLGHVQLRGPFVLAACGGTQFAIVGLLGVKRTKRDVFIHVAVGMEGGMRACLSQRWSGQWCGHGWECKWSRIYFVLVGLCVLLVFDISMRFWGFWA